MPWLRIIQVMKSTHTNSHSFLRMGIGLGLNCSGTGNLLALTVLNSNFKLKGKYSYFNLDPIFVVIKELSERIFNIASLLNHLDRYS